MSLCGVLLPICWFETVRMSVPFHIPMDVPLGTRYFIVASAGFVCAHGNR